jgi:hypothetical protein
MLVESKL